MKPSSTVLFLAIGTFFASAAAQGEAAPPPLRLGSDASGHALAYDGITLHSTPNLILDPRVISIPGTSSLAVLWNEEDAGGQVTSWYVISPDGRSFTRIRAASHLIRLRYAEFDPLIGSPAVEPALAADAASELAIVQFLTRPLPEYSAAIRNLGGRALIVLADQALIAHLTPEARAEAQRLPMVRWVGPVHVAYKLEEEIITALVRSGPLAPLRYSLLLYERGPEAQNRVASTIRSVGGQVHGGTPLGFRLEATLSADQLLAAAGLDDVMFIDRKGEVEADMDIVRAIGGADFVHSTLGFLGTGVRGEVVDTELELTHPEWAHPPIVHLGGGDIVHGTRVYGIVFAQGLNPRARGLLPDGQGIYAYRTPLLGGGPTRYEHTAELVDPDGPYRAVFQTASTGDQVTTEYTTISAEMDDILFLYDILVTQSQSNTGNQNSRPQAWAKNIVACGGIKHQDTLDRNDDTWANYASIGPAADGRVKPDLAHFCDYVYTTTVGGGYTATMSGTSAATPITAGHFGLLFQMWHEGVFPGFGGGPSVFADRPHMTTAKALIVNTAFRYDWHVTGPNSDLDRMKQGWGMADLAKLYAARDRMLIIDETDLLEPFGVKQYLIEVAPDDTELRATLVYADPRGNVGSAHHRINDLSLRATSPLGTVYWGNNGLREGNWSIPGDLSNTIDTVENVFIRDPDPGTWTLEVIADEINEDSHVETPALDADFALVAATDAPPAIPPVPPVLWDNGPLVTHPGQGFGGADASARQSVTLGEAIMGYSHHVAAGARVADDFEAIEPWTVQQIEFWAYQVGAGPGNPTITAVNVRIWDGSPSLPGSRVVHGDSLTNLMTAAVWDTLYRTDETTVPTATERAVYRLICTPPDWSLPPGTYWIDWQADGTLTSGPFVPPISILGQTHPPGANAIQYSDGSWHPVQDTGSLTPDDFKFVLRGKVETTPAGAGNDAVAAHPAVVEIRPNPFNPVVTIDLSFARDGEMSLRIYDVSGRLIRVLATGRVAAGTRSLHWDGRDGAGSQLPSGTYFYELRFDGQVRDIGKAVLLR